MIQAAGTDAGANVVLDVLSQTNVVLTVTGPAQAVTSISLPQALSPGSGSADVRLPTVVTPIGGAGPVAGPNMVAMSVGGSGAEQGNIGAPPETGLMLIVVQYN